jgi:hypothetical protein
MPLNEDEVTVFPFHGNDRRKLFPVQQELLDGSDVINRIR